MTNELAELTKLLHDESWPVAAPKKQICDVNSEDDKVDRADEIINCVFTVTLKDKRVLDLGCGTGHVCKRVSETCMPSCCIGYDLERRDTPLWDKSDGFQLTTDVEVVTGAEAFDVILLYDVLDHTKDAAAAVNLLKLAKHVAAPGAKVFIRNHPWSGRHGGHLYHQINKSHIHVVFTDSELEEMGYEVPKVHKLTHPQKTYSEWLKEAGLGNPKPTLLLEDVPPIFQRGLLRERVRRHWKDSFDKNAVKFPRFQLRQTYVDYTVTI